MISKAVVSAITMEDGGQSAGAKRTTFRAALEFAEVANSDDSPTIIPPTIKTDPDPTPTIPYDRASDIAFNCC